MSKIPDMSTRDGRALAYRDVLRNSLRALVARLVRKTHSDKEGIPSAVVAEMMHEIHVQYLELLRYSQMVIANYAMLMDDERFRVEAMRDALDAVAAIKGAAAAVMQGKHLRMTSQESHKGYKPSLVVFSGGEVEV